MPQRCCNHRHLKQRSHFSACLMLVHSRSVHLASGFAESARNSTWSLLKGHLAAEGPLVADACVGRPAAATPKAPGKHARAAVQCVRCAGKCSLRGRCEALASCQSGLRRWWRWGPQRMSVSTSQRKRHCHSPSQISQRFARLWRALGLMDSVDRSLARVASEAAKASSGSCPGSSSQHKNFRSGQKTEKDPREAPQGEAPEQRELTERGGGLGAVAQRRKCRHRSLKK